MLGIGFRFQGYCSPFSLNLLFLTARRENKGSISMNL